MSPILEFVSDAFPIVPGEDDETNPGLFGRKLAEWLGTRMAAEGLGDGDVIPEDFGWCVPVPCAPYRGYVVCCASDEDGVEADGAGVALRTAWRVFAFVEGGLLRRLTGRDERAHLIAGIFATVKGCLAEAPEIENLAETPD
jgi:hypothetical protein